MYNYYYCCDLYIFELQMWMNAQEAIIAAMIMQLATTVQEITPALATLDTQAMGLYVPVSSNILYMIVLRLIATALCDKIVMHLYQQ